MVCLVVVRRTRSALTWSVLWVRRKWSVVAVHRNLLGWRLPTRTALPDGRPGITLLGELRWC